jgi:hypothetical protein
LISLRAFSNSAKSRLVIAIYQPFRPEVMAVDPIGMTVEFPGLSGRQIVCFVLARLKGFGYNLAQPQVS